MSEVTRRSMAAVLPALLAGVAEAGQTDLLRSSLVNADEAELRKRGDITTGRLFFQGMTRENIRVEPHETILPPGKAPHAAHRHLREEMVILKEGKLKVEVEGEEPKEVTAGGAVYVASNKMHGWTNAGASTATYFVVEIGNNG